MLRENKESCSLPIKGAEKMLVGAESRNFKFIRQALFEKNRILYLEGSFDTSGGMFYSGNDPSLPPHFPTSPRAVIDQILYLETLNHKPIKLIIDHPGGIVRVFFNLHDVIKASKSPVYTIAMGLVASAAVSVLVAGKKRFIFPNSQTMIHLTKGGSHGDEEEMEKQKKEFLKTQQRYIDILAAHTGKSAEIIKEAMKKETWMNSEESIDFGLVSQKVTNLEDIEI